MDPTVSTSPLQDSSKGTLTRLRAWLYLHRWPLALFLLALAIRLHWNLYVHPPSDYDYSDMHGYVQRADELLHDPYRAHPYAAFYPFGTTWLIAIVKYWFGLHNHAALSVTYALWGSLIIPLCYAIASRLHPSTWFPRAVGALLTVYYPLIALGGYTLSEVPSSLALCLSVWLLIRSWELDEAPSNRLNRRLVALCLGVSLGVACTIRTQIVLFIALLALFWLFWRRKDSAILQNLRFPAILWSLAPLVLILGLSSWRVHYHTQEFGLVSKNGPINLAFGRCHLRMIAAKKNNGYGYFSPPPISALISHSERHPDSWLQALPVLGDDQSPVPGVPGFTVDGPIGCKNGCVVKGGEVEYSGYIGDTKVHNKLVRACLERSGVGRQLYFSLVHVAQLWAFNSMWPDKSNPKPRPRDNKRSWRYLSRLWQGIHGIGFAIPALCAIPLALVSKRRIPLAFVALTFLSLIFVAAIVMGGIRFRAPYDPMIIILALWQWQRWITRFAQRRRDRSS